jgi:hypothetical protein
MQTWTYETLKAGGHIIFECVAGSRAYGTAIETSDTDIRYIYVLPLPDMLGLTRQEIINNDTNDVTGYELGKFLALLGVGNPTVLELLAMPEDVILHMHPVYNLVLTHVEKFLTKRLANSLAGYADEQITKAKGLNKLMNQEKEQMTRKTPLDFCRVARAEGGSEPLLHFIDRLGLTQPGVSQRNFGVVPVPKMRNLYALYYSYNNPTFSLPGLLNEQLTSNDLRSASIPEGRTPIRFMSYDKDAYSQHCTKYKQYEQWLAKRNKARYVETSTHGQQIDGKNMMHCRRLLDIAREVAAGQGLHVRRPNREELLAIRRGEVDLQTLLTHAEAEIPLIKALFAASELPDKVDADFIEQLLLTMRLEFYLYQNTTLLELYIQQTKKR